MDETEIWLWPEGRHGEHLRGWTPDETRRFPELIGIEPAIRDPHALITGPCAVPLETGLPSPFADWLVARLRQTSPLRLRLSATLPKAWQCFPYEWLTLDGAPLHDRLRVWRNVPRTAELPTPVHPAPVALLNLWPDTEQIQPPAGLDLSPVDVHRYDGPREVEALLGGQDSRVFSALCLIVHGSEQADALPFRLPDQILWALPPIPLPPLAILLACGDSNGNLLDYAATLLQRGAVAVLAALGQLDARDARALLPRLLQGWLTGEQIGDALDTAQTATTWLGKSRLCLLGAGELRMSEAPTLAERLMDGLAERARAGDDAALCELLPRLTLQTFMDNGELSQATQRLRDHLTVSELGASEANRLWLHRLDPHADALPILTRLWVAPLLTHLAEQHGHEFLNGCRQRLENLAKAHPEALGLYSDWAKAEYRRGHYARAVAATVEGLRCAAIMDEPVIRLLGSLVNLLLDLNLPEPAQTLFDLRDRWLDSDSFTGDFAAQERFKGLDYQGRRALRQGSYEAALLCFCRKRHQAPEHDENGQRELAWLLYAAALVGPTNGDSHDINYAKECQAILADRPEPGSGNDSVLYLLRALAAWAWRRRDAAAWEALAPWLPELKKRLESRQDTGPVGFTLSYLHLYQRESGETLALPDWGAICVALQDDRYFFELAVFSRLLERPRAEIERWLKRYQQERRVVMAKLALENLPNWLHSKLPETGPEDLSDQESRERELLLGVDKPDWNTLIAAHLLPW